MLLTIYSSFLFFWGLASIMGVVCVVLLSSSSL